MAIPISGLVSKEVTALPEGIEKTLRFGGVIVTDMNTKLEVELHGPVDLTRYGSRTMMFTDPATGLPKAAPGITFLVIREDGQVVNRPLNIISKRLIESLHGDLATGSYLKTQYKIIATGPAPSTRYAITREAIPPATGTV